MKKAPEFKPEFCLIERNDHKMVVLFDTATEYDEFRAPRLVTIDTDGVQAITFKLNGFDPVTNGQDQICEGKIELLAQKPDGEVRNYELAECKFRYTSESKPDKSGNYVFPSSFDTKQNIRHGVADAFSTAALTQPGNFQFNTIQTPTQHILAQQPAAIGYHTQPEQKRFNWRVLAAVVAPIVLVAMLWGYVKSRTDPVQEAVARAMATDPNARQEQIDITRQTLREMGLDPGKAGDLGCLAPQ